MNAKHFFSTAALAVALFGSAASASVVIPASEARADGSKLPSPTKVVRFTHLPQYLADATVHVVMTIDESGTPTQISGWKGAPADVVNRIAPVVAQWRFAPAQDKDGNPVSLRVILPLKLVPAR